jgi:hypothetical protein
MTRSVLASAAVLHVLFAAACGGGAPPSKTQTPPPPAAAPAPAAAAPAPAGPSLATLLAREATELPLTRPASTDGPSFAVDAAGAPSFEVKDDVVQATIPIGTAEAVRCFVRSDSIPTASLLYTVIDNVKKHFPKQAIAQLDVAIAEQIPYILAEVQYAAQADGKETFGTIKMMAIEREDDTLLCMHDEVGYRATFRRVAEQLARTLTLPDAEHAEPASELTIAIARIGAQRVGFELSRHWAQPDGKHIEASSMALLLPGAAGQISSLDMRRATTSGKDGVVTQIRVAADENTALSRDLKIERTAAGKYHVEGTFRDKPAKADFTTKKPILARWRERNEIRDKMLGGPKARELTFVGYSPNDDVAGATPSVWRATAEPNVLESTFGKTVVRQTVDADARETVGVSKLGQVDLTLERILFVPRTAEAKKPEPKPGK